MIQNKRVLLIAGGGTLGTYVSQELLRLGAEVEVICPEEKTSNNDRLIFHQSLATDDLLRNLFSKKHYDGIVNFIHYEDAEDYKKIYPLLIANTDHLIFLSSYRVYANEQHPITEDAPQLVDVIKDTAFLEQEKYAVPKSICEEFLRKEHAGEPWTIVRPVISFSERRMDLYMYSGSRLLRAADQGEELLLPRFARDYSAGLDWAGNSGKLIANLLFKPDALGEAFTISSGHGLTWGAVAQLYQKALGLKIRWCTEKEYLDCNPKHNVWRYWQDRRYDRDMDCSKVLRVTGLAKEDFATVEEGIKKELSKLGR